MANKKSNIRFVGLDYLQFGPVTASGAMPAAASLNTIGNIVPDTAKLLFAEPTVTDFFVEEEETPDLQIRGTGKKSIEFATRDLGTNMLVYAFGANGSTTATVYRLPTTTQVTKEVSIFAKTKTINGKYLTVSIPRASLTASADLRFSRTETGQLAFKCDVMQPNSSTAISPIVFAQG